MIPADLLFRCRRPLWLRSRRSLALLAALLTGAIFATARSAAADAPTNAPAAATPDGPPYRGAAETAGPNLLPAGDFEGDALTQGWNWTAGSKVLKVAPASGRTGGHGVELIADAATGRGKFHSIEITVPADSAVRVTVWAKADHLIGGVWGNLEHGDDGLGKFDIAGGTYDWTRTIFRFTAQVKGVAPGQPLPFALWFYVYGTGRLTLDDVAVSIITPDTAAEAAREKSAEAQALAVAAQTHLADLGLAATAATRHIFRDRPCLAPCQPRVSVDLCRHELEDAQVLVFATGQQNLTDVKLSLDDLHGPGQAVLPASDVEILPVAYADRSKAPPVPWYEGPSSNWWPDALLPNRSFTVQAGTVQPVYLRFHGPDDTPGGDYTGTLSVHSSAGTATLPVTVHLWPIAMPVRLGMRSILVAGKADPAYLDLCLENRVPLANIAEGMSWTQPLFPVKGDSFDFSAVEKKLQYCFDHGMNAFILASAPKAGKWGFPKAYSPEWQHTMAHVVKEYAAFLKSKGWLDRAFFYNIDEPPPALLADCKTISKLVKTADPDVKVMQCVNDPGAAETLRGSVDLWDMYIRQYHEDQGDARKADGGEMWWSVCIWPGERPNLFVEDPLMDARIVGWAAMKYGIGGFEYWDLTAWDKDNAKDDAWITCPGGVLTTAWQFTRAHSGDGYLVYPGSKDTPVNSLRFEALRDGLEDNELLRQLQAKLPQLSAADQAEARKLIDGGDGLVTTCFVYSTVPERLEQTRRRVLLLLNDDRQP
ncbi:MAG: glycoside hydrolase domain-containing protein [Planctomycetota bacterium]